MANTAATYPGTTATTKYSGENNTWSDSGNIVSDNASYASITASTFDNTDISYGLTATNFDFSSLPSGATINGIVVEVERYYANGTVSDYQARLIYGGTLQGTAQTTGTNWGAFPSSVGIVTIGSSTSNWGYTGISATIVKTSTFGVVYWCQSTGTDSDAFVDYIRMTVYYTVSIDYPISITTNLSLSASTTVARAYHRASTANLSLAPSATITFDGGAVDYPISCTANLSLSASVSKSIDYNRSSTSLLSVLSTLLRSWAHSWTNTRQTKRWD